MHREGQHPVSANTGKGLPRSNLDIQTLLMQLEGLQITPQGDGLEEIVVQDSKRKNTGTTVFLFYPRCFLLISCVRTAPWG